MLADGTAVGSSTEVRPDGTFSVVLDTAHRFAASGDSLTLYVRETTASGETASGSAQHVTYDITPPTVTIDSGGGGVTTGSVTLTGHLTAPYGAGRSTGTIEILDNHLFVGLGVFNSDGSWSAEVSLRGEGPHLLTAQASDAAGNLGESAPVTATLRSPLTSYGTLHALTNTQTLDGSGSSAGRTVQVTLADGTPVGASAIARADGTFTVVLDTSHRFAASGAHLALYVHETDTSGRSGVGGVQQVTYDVTPPTVTIDSGGGTTTGTVHLSGHLTAPYGAGRSTGTLDILDNHLRVGSGSFNTDGSWSGAVALTGEGAHSLTAQATDSLGNIGESAAVTATVRSPLISYGTLRPLTNTQTLDGYGSSAGRTVQVTLADGTPVGPAATVATDGTFRIALDQSHRFAASGNHLALYVHETDTSGRTGVGSLQQVTYDVTPPTVTIDGGGGETTGTVHLTGHLAAPYGAGRSAGTIEILDNHHHVGLGTFSTDGSWSATVALTGTGAHLLTAQATDSLGNLGESAAVTATVTLPPTPFTTNSDAFGSYVHDGHSVAGSVYALYDGLLGRTADALGLESWMHGVAHGLSLHDIADQFLSSPEGQARAGALGNAAFVEQLYNATLHRHSDADGLSHWVSVLDAGASRADVGLGFSLSPEHLGSLAGAFGSGVFAPDFETAEVARLYYTVLDRAPDASGLAYWTSLVHGGTPLDTVTRTFLQAPEVQALTGHMSTAQFVDFVYANALGRHAEADGLGAWVERIDHAGQSRVDVATAIGQSAEAQGHLLPGIEAGWHLI